MKPRNLFLLASFLASTCPAGADILDRVIVKVNGDIVTQSEFEARQVAAVQGARIGPERIEAYLRENNARILQDAIDDLLLIQKADEVGIRVRPEYTKDIIEGIKKEQNIPSDAALRDQLRREGMTLDDMKRNIERSIIKRQVVNKEIEPKVVVTDADLRADYERRKDEFTHPAQVSLQEILVGSDQIDAKATAQELVTRARAGEDFAALARDNSAAATRKDGGDLGKLAVQALHSDVRSAVEPLPVGGVTEPIAGPDGTYRIFRVSERSEEGLTPFDDVKADLRKKLVDTGMLAEYDKLLKELRAKAIIDVRVREVPLQVQVPTTASILDPPSAEPMPGKAKAEPAAADDAEFVVSPQTAPERTSPVPAPSPDPAADPNTQPPSP
jgi:parvulin-like peptidyl-prolyl isomerase